MKGFMLLTIALMMAVFLSCGIKSEVAEFSNEKELTADYDAVWQAVIETFSEKSIPIDNMEKVSGYINTREMAFSNEWADCGATPIGIEFKGDILGTFNVFVKENDTGQCLVTVNTIFHIETDNIFYEGCTSTGKMEEWFLKQVADKLDIE